MRPPLTFDRKDVGGLPSRAWARAWAAGAPDYWSLVLTDYRDRVRTFYSEAVETEPDAFPLWGPVELRVVVSLVHTWVFAHGADMDSVWVDEQWEHEQLASPDVRHSPREAQVGLARRALRIDEVWRLIDASELEYPITGKDTEHPQNPFDEPTLRHPSLYMQGWNLADGDASLRSLNAALDNMRDRSVDRASLNALRPSYADLCAFGDEQERGRRFDVFIHDLLAAHGCVVERGKFRYGEQVDVFVHRPFRALVECRWEREPVGASPISLLIQKLMRDRPAVVAGIYVSMSDFTGPAKDEAATKARDRAVVLFGRNDVETLLDGSMHVADLFEERIDALVRRY